MEYAAGVHHPSLDPATDFSRWIGGRGRSVAAHRTGDLVHLPAEHSPVGYAVALKIYRYPTARDRRRGWFRNTLFAASRVRKEARNLERLSRVGLNPPLLIATGEQRRCGELHTSFVVTRWVNAPSLADQWSDLDLAERRRAIRQLGRWVARAHDAGYVDRDLHLRNFLWTPDSTDMIKIDCPRGTFRPPWLHRWQVRRDLQDLGADVQRVLSVADRRRLLATYRRQRGPAVTPTLVRFAASACQR